MYHYCIDARCCSDSRYRGNLPLRGFSSCRGVARPCQTTLFARIELRSGSRSPPLGTMLDMKFLIQGMVAWGPRLFNNSLFDSETRPSSAPSYTLPPLASAFLLLLFFFSCSRLVLKASASIMTTSPTPDISSLSLSTQPSLQRLNDTHDYDGRQQYQFSTSPPISAQSLYNPLNISPSPLKIKPVRGGLPTVRLSPLNYPHSPNLTFTLAAMARQRDRPRKPSPFAQQQF